MTAVVVTRDRPRLFADALASVAAQSLAPLEVQVANAGGSEVAVAAQGGLEITTVPARDRWAAAARNLAARGARGEVLAFLDDDDRWLPDHLAHLADALADPAVALAYSDSAVVRERVAASGERVELERRVIARDWDPAFMRHDDYLPPSTWLVRRSLFERLGGFDESFRFSEDWDFLMRAALLTTPRRAKGVSVEIRMREGGNASADFGLGRIDCLKRLAARHGLPPIEPRTFWEVAEIVAAAEGRA
ncbi:MAG TPA: glycosyltransferase [Candidatus Eisenbacteria bacterium]